MADKETEIRIVIAPDGPYIVTGNIPLSKQTIGANDAGESQEWIEGEQFATPTTYALCRCGESQKRPFCDGTLVKTGFDGTETASREPFFAQAKVFDGPSLRLADVRSLCADGRFCDPNGKVWNQAARTDDPEIRATFLRRDTVPVRSIEKQAVLRRYARHHRIPRPIARGTALISTL